MNNNLNIHSIPQPSAVPYWNMIKDSSREVKETLLNMLYISLDEESINVEDNGVNFLSGTWEDNRSSEEIIADIRHARTSNKDVCTLFD